MVSPLHPGFVAKTEAKNIPFMNTAMHAISCIFVNRGGTEAERNKVVEDIITRQVEIEDSGQKFNPLCIFPEGTTTGGTHLLPFKRGAFQAMRTVQPCFVKFTWGVVNPAFDVVDLLDILVLIFCNIVPTLSTLYIMPPFVPNKYMLDKHNDKG